MKKIIIALSVLIISASAFAQSGDVKIAIDENWCPTRDRIQITGGIFDGKYISCPKGRDMQKICAAIAQDLADLYEKSGADKVLNQNSGAALYDNAQTVFTAMKAYQTDKLAKVKKKTQYPFYYAMDMAWAEYIPYDQLQECDKDKETNSYIFWLASDSDKQLNKGNVPSKGSDFTVYVGYYMIYVRDDRGK